MTDAQPPTPALDIDQEIANFLDVIARIRPVSPGIGLGGIEIWGGSRYLTGAAGGDHIIYVDFNNRYDLDRRIERARGKGRDEVAARLAENRSRIGILLADVSGHRLTDALVTAMLHQAFLTGVLYELDRYGEVTTRLFENLNTRFFNSTSIEKFMTVVYGEISESGTFRFISAGHPAPQVFSAEFDCLVTISRDRLVSVYPLGMFPSEDDVDASRQLGALRYKPRYTVNEVNLMSAGDVLLLATDGLRDHERGDDEPFVPQRLETVLRQVKGGSAREIHEAVLDAAAAFAPFTDDTSLIVIKRKA
jgi:serine phosphatase RsbU (regulator of sigma subunit)